MAKKTKSKKMVKPAVEPKELWDPAMPGVQEILAAMKGTLSAGAETIHGMASIFEKITEAHPDASRSNIPLGNYLSEEDRNHMDQMCAKLVSHQNGIYKAAKTLLQEAQAKHSESKHTRELAMLMEKLSAIMITLPESETPMVTDSPAQNIAQEPPNVSAIANDTKVKARSPEERGEGSLRQRAGVGRSGFKRDSRGRAKSVAWVDEDGDQ